MTNSDMDQVTIITIDGPSGSGKGTVSRMLAKKLKYHYLDSGALYRLVGLAAKRHCVDLTNHASLAVLAGHMDVRFETSADGQVKVFLEGEDVSQELRTEETGALASQVAAYREVRHALLDRQRHFAQKPGLVADGRDMGSVVFPEARVKIYLTASAEERAQRRHDELLEKGEDVSLRALVEQVRLRDERDMTRSVSPLVPAKGSIELDTSEMSIPEVLEAIFNILTVNSVFKR